MVSKDTQVHRGDKYGALLLFLPSLYDVELFEVPDCNLFILTS